MAGDRLNLDATRSRGLPISGRGAGLSVGQFTGRTGAAPDYPSVSSQAGRARPQRRCADVVAHNLARWTTRIGLGEPVATTKTLRRRFFSLAGRITRKARRLTLHLPQGWPWQNQFSSALAKRRALPLPS